MPDDFVEQQNHRRTIGFRNIKGFHGHLENVLVIRCGQRHDGMIPMGSPPRLIDISLAHMGGNTGGRSASLNVDDDTGDFRHDGITQCFLHQ